MNESPETPGGPQYQWPRFLIAAVILAILLAILWMAVAVRRTRQYRDPNPFPPQNKSATSPSTNTESKLQPVDDRLAEFRGLLAGGNADAGKKIFFEKPEASCGKCHRIQGQGGENGPALDDAGKRQTREQILEAILFPNLKTTTNFETVILLLKNGSGYSGTLKSEDESSVRLNTTEDGLVTIHKQDIQLRQKGLSPMPEGIAQILSREDLRDLVEFVATQKN
jgi:putative heme-binding domain-containing protein